MGTWALHAFGNDEAADFLDDLTAKGDLELVTQAVQDAVEQEDYLEAPSAELALAAIEVLCALRGSPSPLFLAQKDLPQWLDEQAGHDAQVSNDTALQAIDRLLGGSSELAELYEESDENEAWRNGVLALRERVAGLAVEPQRRAQAGR